MCTPKVMDVCILFSDWAEGGGEESSVTALWRIADADAGRLRVLVHDAAHSRKASCPRQHDGSARGGEQLECIEGKRNKRGKH